MSSISNRACLAGTAGTKARLLSMKPIAGLLALALLLASWPARAEGPEDEYLQIRTLILAADDLDAGGKAAPAKAKYQQAYAALKRFQGNYPEWQAKLVSARLNYVTQKLAPPPEKPPAETATGTTTNAAAAQSVAQAATQTATTQVKLLQPGAEPRKVLRLHPSPGDKQTLSMTMKMAGESKVGETPTPAMKLPGLKMTLGCTVKEVSDNGNIAYGLVLSDFSVSDEPGGTPEAAAAMKAIFAGVKGLTGTGTASSRGHNESAAFEAPAGSNPQTRQLADQMKDLFTQLLVPLPEEAVGPGAKWEVKTPLKSQGMTVDQTATYELVSLEGERLTTKSTLAQHAANQKIQNPAMPGMKMDLTKMTGKGSGERTFDLAHLLPTAGAANFHTETAMTMNMGSQKQAMTMKMDIELRFEAK
jgi:hypothetical protein